MKSFNARDLEPGEEIQDGDICSIYRYHWWPAVLYVGQKVIPYDAHAVQCPLYFARPVATVANQLAQTNEH